MISPRPRIATVLLSLAVLAGASLAPGAAQAAPAATAVQTSSTGTDELRLDRAEAQRIRERVAGITAQHPSAFAQPGSMSAQAVTVRTDVVRTAGANRYEVAANLADLYWGQYFWNPKYGPIDFQKVVFVASGHDYPDALSGGAAAAAWGGPMLLTTKTSVPRATRDTLSRLKPDVIVVLGGTNTISTAVEGQLREFVTTATNVTRVDGANRFEVSARLARLTGWSEVAYLASGRVFPDGLSGGAAAGSQVAPLLITEKDKVPSVVLKALQEEVLPSRVYVLGGTASVSDDVIRQLTSALPGVRVQRIDGANRYEVAANVAAHLPSQGVATIANGQNWPDALSGSALAGLIGSKMLLTHPGAKAVTPFTRNPVVNQGLASIDVLGGTSSVPERFVTELKNLRVNDLDAG